MTTKSAQSKFEQERNGNSVSEHTPSTGNHCRVLEHSRLGLRRESGCEIYNSMKSETDRRYRTLFNNAPDAIFTMSVSDLKITDCNKKVLETFDCGPAEFIGKTPCELSPPQQYDGSTSKSKVLMNVKKLLQSQGPTTFAWLHQRSGGETFDAEVSLSVLDREPEMTILAIVRDVTQRKRRNQKIRLVQHWVEHSVDLFFWVREDSQVLYVNKTVCQALGYSLGELRDMRVSDFDLTLPRAAWPGFASKLKSERNLCFESRLRRKNGTSFPVEIAANALKFEGRDHFFAYGRDISVRVKAEEERSKLENQLVQVQKMEAIGTLAGGIAHDFNNILSAILGFAELAQLELPQKALLAGYIENILRAGNRAKDLVEQILAFSRQTEQTLMPVPVRSIVKETLKLLRASLPTTIEIKHDLASDSKVMGDATKLHQIVMNLCSNAGYAMRNTGGTLHVQLRDIRLPTEYENLYPGIDPGAYIELTISDTGEGMAPETMERIYDPFFTTKERGQGAGMGLSAVHGIVKDYGGIIHVSSQFGKGSIFKVDLPIIENQAESEVDIQEPLPRGQEHVLIIDDEPDIVEIGKLLLENIGYTVVSRVSSLEALELFKSQPEQFDLVITDLTMPQMTGDKLAKELIAIRPDIPIILCSGYSTQITEEAAEKIGIKAILMKPIIIKEMANLVRNVLDESAVKV